MIALWGSAWAACLVVQGGSVWGGDGPRPGDLVAVDGRIAAVGQVPGITPKGERAVWQGRDCERVALPAGSVVTPGFIESRSPVGLVEVAGESSTVDSRGTGDPIRASLVVSEAYNPRSVHVPVLRLGGITGAVIVPADGQISGQGGFVRLAGGSWDEAVVERSVAMFGNLGPARAEGLGVLRALLEDARAWGANAAAVEGNRYREFADGASRQDLEALLKVARREIPLVLAVDRASEIEAVLRLARDARIDVIVQGGAEGWMVADQLAAANVPVIVDPLVSGPVSFGAVHGRMDNAALLAAAGVTVLLTADGAHNAPTLGQIAGNAVRAGMSPQDALAAITVNPARVFGLDDRGTLTVGAVADVVAWSGDPLELSSDVLLVLVDGARQPLVSRQTELVERYRTLPGSPVPALR